MCYVMCGSGGTFKEVGRMSKKFDSKVSNYQTPTKSYPFVSFSPLLLLLLFRHWDVWLCNPTNCSPPGSSVHGISQQEYGSGLPFPTPGDFSNPGLESASPALPGRFFTTEPPGKPKMLSRRLTWSNLCFQKITVTAGERAGGDPRKSHCGCQKSRK